MRNIQLLQELQRRVGSADWSKWQILRWQFYDYVRLPETFTELSFLVNPAGTTDPTSSSQKRKSQTNMPKSRTFGQVFFIIEAIRTDIQILPKPLQPAGINDDVDLILSTYDEFSDLMQNLVQAGVMEISLGQKTYFDIPQPFQYCPPGFGIDIKDHGVVTTTSTMWRQDDCPSNIYQASPAQLVEPEQTIDLKITFPDGTPVTLTNAINSTTPRINAGVILDGFIARPAQ